MTQRLSKVSDWPLNTEIFLEETVIELLFVSPFQFGCFIEALGKVKMGH